MYIYIFYTYIHYNILYIDPSMVTYIYIHLYNTIQILCKVINYLQLQLVNIKIKIYMKLLE